MLMKTYWTLCAKMSSVISRRARGRIWGLFDFLLPEDLVPTYVALKK